MYSSASAYRKKESFGLSLRKLFKVSIRFIEAVFPPLRTVQYGRMKDFRKDFDTIDQARTRPIEIGRSVDSVKLSTPSRQKSSTPVFFDCPLERDRKSTRLNSSHSQISYAVFCLKKKKTT